MVDQAARTAGVARVRGRELKHLAETRLRLGEVARVRGRELKRSFLI